MSTGHFLTLPSVGPLFRVPSPALKIQISEWVSGFFGARVPIGLYEKCARTNGFSESDIFRFHPHPSGMRPKSEGLSHALPNRPPDCLVPSLIFWCECSYRTSRKCAHTNDFRHQTYTNLIHIHIGCVSNPRDSPTS